MKVSTYKDVINSFHSTFQDKVALPEELERIWFLKAVGKFSLEFEPLYFDEEVLEFSKPLERHMIDTLGLLMKKYYQERELSKVNKRVSIVGKDISIDASNGTKEAAKNELDYINSELKQLTQKQMSSEQG